MPNANAGNVDERIVEMRIDHQKFESGAKKTISILEKLDKGLESLTGKNTDGFDKITSSLDVVDRKFSALGTIGDQVLRNLTNRAMALVDQMGKMAKSMSIDQIAAGWDKYADKTQGVQTIMAATAKDWDDQAAQMEYVNAQLEKLNWFTDETSYNFLDMVNNIGKFTSNGVDLDTAVTAMEGISTWAALSGANVNEASRAMYNLSQALATGSVKLIDWKSIENANMATREFKETALETAADLGQLVKVGDGMWRTLSGKEFTTEQFNTELSEGWFNSETLLKTLNLYGEFTNVLNEASNATGMTATQMIQAVEAYKKGDTGLAELKDIANEAHVSVADLIPYLEELSSEGYELGFRAFKAAQEAKTFKEAVDATKDAVSTGWMNLFETMFGNYLQAKGLWTDIANSFYNIFAEPVNWLNELADHAFGDFWNREREEFEANANFDELQADLETLGFTFEDFERAYRNLDGKTVDDLTKKYGSLENAIKSGAVTSEQFVSIIEMLGKRLRDKSGNTDILTSSEDPEGQKAAEAAAENYSTSMKLSAEAQAVYDKLLGSAGRLTNTEESDLERLTTGSELFTEALKNLVGIVEDTVGAIDNTLQTLFGDNSDPENPISWMAILGDRLYETIGRFRDFTVALRKGIDFEALGDRIVSVAGAIGYFARILGSVLGFGLRTTIKIISTFAGILLKIFDIARKSGVFQAFGRAIHNIFDGIVAPLKIIGGLVKDTFDKIFGIKLSNINWAERLAYYLSVLADRIDSASKRFKTFMESEEVAQKITAAFEKVKDVVGDVVNAISKVASAVGGFITSLVNGYKVGGLSGVFEVLDTKIKELLKDHPFLLKIYSTLTSIFGGIGSLAASGYRAVSEWISSLDFSKIQQYLPTMESLQKFFQDIKDIGLFGSISDKIVSFFGAIGDFFSGTKFDTSGISSAFDNIKNVFGVIFDGLFGDPEEFKQRVKNAFLNIFNGLKEALDEITLGDVIRGMRLAGFAALLTEIAGIFKTFKDLEKEVKGIPENISEMFGKLGDAFGSLSLSFKTNVLLKLLIGVGILAASLYALSKLDQDKLTHAAVVIGILFAVIASIAKNISSTKLIGSNVDIKHIQVIPTLAGTLFSLAAVIISIGGAIALITNAIHKAGADNVWTAVGMLGVFLGSIAAIVIILFAMAKKLSTYKRMDAIGTMMLKLGGSMYFIATAIGSIVLPIIALGLAIKYIGNEHISQAAWDLFAFAVTLGLIVAGLTALLTFSKNATPAKIDKIGNTLLKLGGSMMLISMAIGALVVPMIAIAAGIRFINSENGNEMGKAGAWLAIFALVLAGIVAGLMLILSSKNMTPARIDKIGNTMLKIAGSMALIAVGIGMLATPLIAIAAAIKLLGSDNMGLAFNAILAFAGIMAVLAGIALLAGKFGNGPGMLMAAGAMALLALGINLLVPALISFIAIGASLAALAVNIDNFWEAAARLGKLATTMLIFGFGIMMAGVGVAAFGIGISLAAVSALVFAAAAWVLSKALGELATAFPAFIEGIAKAGDAIAKNWKSIILGTAAFVALAVAIGWMIKQVGKLISGERFGRGIGTFFASLATGIGQMASSIGTKITEVFPKILQILGSLLVLAALHLVGLIPDLTHIMVEGFVTLFDSVAYELETNSEAVIGSVTSIVEALLNTISGVFESTILSSDFWGKLDLLTAILFGLGSGGLLIGLVKNLLAPFKVFAGILGGGTGVAGRAADAKAAIELIVEAAGGLGTVLTVLGVIVAASAYAIDNINKQKEILSDNAFAGAEKDAAGYEQAISNVENRIAELKDYELNWGGDAMSSQELAALEALLAQLKSEYQELLDSEREALNASDLSTAAARDEKFAMRNGTEPVAEVPVSVKPELASDATAGIQTEIEAAKELLTTQIDSAAMELMGEVGGADGIGSMIMSTISGDITDNGGLMTSALTDTEQTAIDSASASAYAMSLTNGYNVSSGLAQGIYNGSPLVQKAMNWLSSLTVVTTQKGMEMHSPSRVMARLAEYIPAGIAVGIKHNAGEAVDSMTVLGSSILAAMQMAMLRVATVADERFEFSPTITPVVDMSNVDYAAGSANSMFGTISSGLRGSIHMSAETARNAADAVYTNVNTSSIIEEVQRLSGKLDSLGEAVTNMQIVLDTGVLVGSTSRQMDDAFGTIQMRKGRGN